MLNIKQADWPILLQLTTNMQVSLLFSFSYREVAAAAAKNSSNPHK